MRFPSTFLDEIRERLKISDVVGQRVQFDKKKTNSARGDYWGCCPFHGENTPSFHCEDRKGRYHCFGCGASGDHFKFLSELDGLAFPEVVERLASQAGLSMPVMSEKEQRQEQERFGLLEVMEMAAEFFRDQLQGPPGAKARAYLRDRGLSSATQQFFGIGFAPENRNALKEYLASRNIGLDLMERCGLIVKRDGQALAYDRFRDRIMFPIPNAKGQTIAFGGRAMSSDTLAKYLNSPETELFHKSNVLYNYANARQSAYAKKQVIVAEGYMDVIALHAAGFENAVAPLGTALTERQLALLWKMHHEPILCFDGDGAGLNAAYRSIDLALAALTPGYSLRFAMLPEGKDPDDLVREEGSGAMNGVLANAQPLSRMLWYRETSKGVFETPEKRAELERDLKRIVNQIRDEDVRRYYSQDMKERLFGFFQSSQPKNKSSFQRPAERFPNRTNHYHSRDVQARQSKPQLSRINASPSLLNSNLMKRKSGVMALREVALIAGIVFHPTIAVARFEEFSSLVFQNATAKRLQSIVLDELARSDVDENLGSAMIKTKVIECGLAQVLEQLERQLREARLWQYLPEAAYEDATDGWIQAYTLHLKNQTLSNELRAAESALVEENTEQSWERLRQIRDELAKTEGTEALIDGFGMSSGRPTGGF